MEKCCKQCVNPETVASIKQAMMSDEALYDIADFFKALGDSTRMKILTALLSHEACVTELSEAIGLGQSAISHQLRVLRQNNLVKFRKEGKSTFYALDDSHVRLLLSQAVEHVLHTRHKVAHK